MLQLCLPSAASSSKDFYLECKFYISLTTCFSLRFVRKQNKTKQNLTPLFKHFLQAVRGSFVCCSICWFAGRGKCTEGFQQRPAQRQTAGRDNNRLPETEAWRHSGRSHRKNNTTLSLRCIFTLNHNHCFDSGQRIFTDFVTVEMIFHAKALEVYTHTYHNLGALDIQKDLEVRWYS